MKGWIVAGALAGATACHGNVVSLGSGDDGGVAGTAGDGGVTIIASGLEEVPGTLASDGTSLFFLAGGSVAVPGEVLSRTPVLGGPITTVVPSMPNDASPNGGFLAVDDVNVYYMAVGGLYRTPKGGAGIELFSDVTNASIYSATVLGSNVYWVDGAVVQSGGLGIFAIKSTPLKGGGIGGGISTIAAFQTPNGPLSGINIGVTASSVFLSGFPPGLTSFSLATGVPDGGTPAKVPGTLACGEQCSDADAIYCNNGTSITRVASDGTETPLAPVVTRAPSGIATTMAIDDTYVYWLEDLGTDGAIRRVPKTGGTSITLAHDASPVALTVDASAVYWSAAPCPSQNNCTAHIMRLPK